MKKLICVLFVFSFSMSIILGQILNYGLNPKLNFASQLVTNPSNKSDGTTHFNNLTAWGLSAFIEDFELKTAIPLEPIYTGKMVYAIYDLIKKHYFKPGERIIAIHTGGLQGKRGFN